MKFRFLFSGFFCCALTFLMPDCLAAETLRAGLAKVDITPTQPVTLSGYASRTNLSLGVHDPLSARALVLEQDGQRLVLISTDLIGFYGDTAARIREELLKGCNLQPAELFLCAIHTHSAPTVTLDAKRAHPHNLEYTKALPAKLIELVRQATQRLEPVHVSVGVGASPVGANRRERVVDAAGRGRTVLGRNPAGPTDREVQVLRVVHATSAEPRGVLFTYATHSTSLGPRNLMISGDVHGLAAQFVEKQLGAQVIVPAFAGASGDIDPWYRVLPEFNTTPGWIPEPILLGTLLGEEVVHVVKRLPAPQTNTVIRSQIETIQLPRKPNSGSPNAASSSVPFIVTVARVGDTAFVGLGGEVFHEIGQAIKAGSPFRHTFIFTHCNGAAGYIPTRASYAQGGYEVDTSAVSSDAADQLTREALRMLQTLVQ